MGIDADRIDLISREEGPSCDNWVAPFLCDGITPCFRLPSTFFPLGEGTVILDMIVC